MIIVFITAHVNNNAIISIIYSFIFTTMDKMQDICNLIGQNSVHSLIFFIFTTQISMELKARKVETGKK